MSILDNEAGTGPRASKNSAKLVIRVSSGIDGHQREGGGTIRKILFVSCTRNRGREENMVETYLLSSGERPRN